MNSAESITMFNVAVEIIGDILVGSLPTILAIMSAMIGLGLAVRYIFRWLGHRSVDMHNKALRNTMGMKMQNYIAAGQLRNEELLGYGDKVQRVDKWL